MDLVAEKYNQRPSTLLEPTRKYFKTEWERLLFDAEFAATRDYGKPQVPELDGSVSAEILRKRALMEMKKKEMRS